MPLAAAGHDVTAVDRDVAMLDRARARWAGSASSGGAGTLSLIEHDLTTLDLPDRFDLVLVALNSLLLLDDRAEQVRALSVMRAHLAPGGRAVIDVWLPTDEDLALYDGRQVLEWVRTDTETGERVAKTTAARYEPATRSATLTTTFDAERAERDERAESPQGDGQAARRAIREDRITFIAKDELLAAAANAGLEPVTIAGDYTLHPWSEASERVVLICRTKAA